MELRKKLHNDGWIDIDDNHAIKVDYPTLEQHEILEQLVLDNMDNQKVSSSYKFYKLLIKYCIKDWKGFDEECVVENGELAKDLYALITYSISQTMELGNLINKEIEFLEVDKKK